jgi:hydrogenase maturation factor
MDNMVTAVSSTALSYMGNERYALDNAINNIIAAGGKPCGIAETILLPEHCEEAQLRRITGNLAALCEGYQVEIVAGHTELIPTVSAPTVVITAYGRVLWESKIQKKAENLDLVMTKWAGIYGGALLATLRREELAKRYPESYLAEAAGLMEYTSLMPELAVLEAAVAEKPGCIYAAHDVSNGGVFGALWQLLSAGQCGITIPYERIPMKQEIIEICEFYDINPYMLHGQGSLLLLTSQGEWLVNRMREAGVEANVLGKTNSSSNRTILVGEEERFLVPPKGDALHVVFHGQKRQI